MEAIRVRRMGPGDDAHVHSAAHLFDRPLDPAATARFLASADHHLLIGFIGAAPVGFVTGVELTHPDKGTEMFLYELAVDSAFRGRGFGSALVGGLAALARDRGCYGMWVLTDDDNVAAIRAYERAGGRRVAAQRMLDWRW